MLQKFSDIRFEKSDDGTWKIKGTEKLTNFELAVFLVSLPLFVISKSPRKYSHEVNTILLNMQADGVPRLTPRPGDISRLVNLAFAGDQSARTYLKKVAADLLLKSQKLPSELSKFAAAELNGQLPKKGRGRGRNANIERDFIIARAVEGLVRRGLPHNGGPNSACALVAEALLGFDVLLTEDGVRKAVERTKVPNNAALSKEITNALKRIGKSRQS
ncbi:hypothetical protein [Ruegeria sp. HKCCA4008]|uniref:hypothetical protein n=1 Tax=Ruegeria sp. HKCCA4008 TaxID=2682999 RepID=UPI001C2CB0B8|nr:hypothetical protein [Ruegeria sp. HKCCA4008]